MDELIPENISEKLRIFEELLKDPEKRELILRVYSEIRHQILLHALGGSLSKEVPKLQFYSEVLNSNSNPYSQSARHRMMDFVAFMLSEPCKEGGLEAIAYLKSGGPQVFLQVTRNKYIGE